MYKTNERRAVIIMRVKSEATMHFIKQPTRILSPSKFSGLGIQVVQYSHAYALHILSSKISLLPNADSVAVPCLLE